MSNCLLTIFTFHLPRGTAPRGRLQPKAIRPPSCDIIYILESMHTNFLDNFQVSIKLEHRKTLWCSLSFDGKVEKYTGQTFGYHFTSLITSYICWRLWCEAVLLFSAWKASFKSASYYEQWGPTCYCDNNQNQMIELYVYDTWETQLSNQRKPYLAALIKQIIKSLTTYFTIK